LTYDARRGVVVLFGGWDFANDMRTWEYDGTTWADTTPAVCPPTRRDHSLAYDAARGQAVLFGGSFRSDTWEYDGKTWVKKSTAVSPVGRAEHGLVYDAGRRVVVLFGGVAQGWDFRFDTWEYDGTTWLEKTSSPSPPACKDPRLAYDAGRAVVVLFGDGCTTDTTALPDTWEYDGGHWTAVSPAASPPSRFHHALAYDVARGRVVLFGGLDSTSLTALSDTWEYDGTAWKQLTPAVSPPARSDHSMTYDSARRRVVLFGGAKGTSSGGHPMIWDTWEYHWTSDWPDELCDNGADDDSDGATDCVDPDCEGKPCGGGVCSGGVCR